MELAETAVERFNNGHSCSQAVFSALAERLGMDCEMAVRVAAGFGGGMGRLGATCGLRDWRPSQLLRAPAQRSGCGSQGRTCELVRKFAERFRKLRMIRSSAAICSAAT